MDIVSIIQWAVVLLFALSVHESAHAWAANRLGDPTAQQLGRISLNPLVHADPVGTFLFPLAGLYFAGVAFGWAKPVPVDVGRLRDPKRDYALVAAAGPLSNVAMASVLLVILLALKYSSPSMELVVFYAIGGASDGVVGFLASTAYLGIVVNIILAIFNMIPLAPLDGAAVLSGILPEWLSRPLDSIQSFGFIILLGLLWTGVPYALFSPVIETVTDLLRL